MNDRTKGRLVALISGAAIGAAFALLIAGSIYLERVKARIWAEEAQKHGIVLPAGGGK